MLEVMGRAEVLKPFVEAASTTATASASSEEKEETVNNVVNSVEQSKYEEDAEENSDLEGNLSFCPHLFLLMAVVCDITN